MTGVDLISKERDEQITKHGRTLKSDQLQNSFQQLRIAANKLTDSSSKSFISEPPINWSYEVWDKMRSKNYKERLIIAGALIAAELDRINQPNEEG